MLGLPGSGKSHFASNLAKEAGAIWLNSDLMRAAMFEKPQDMTDPKLRYDAVFGAMDHVARLVLQVGVDVIYDANNHKRAFRHQFQELAHEVGAGTLLIYMQTPTELSDKRASERPVVGHQVAMSAEKLAKHKSLLEAPEPDEATVLIDGTIPFAQQYASFKEQFGKNWGEL
ncbi:MAG: hypothetical protein JWS12_845 [Candidatus Saccharibacteria bacterium]|nr:hypothetical protein [Candidatus Saccharibacteria bacterium]